MTPEDVVFKLGQLQPVEIARLMKDAGVLALRSCSTACAVTQYVYQETKQPNVGTGLATLWYGNSNSIVGLPGNVMEFIRMFDNGKFPELDAEHPMNQGD